MKTVTLRKTHKIGSGTFYKATLINWLKGLLGMEKKSIKLGPGNIYEHNKLLVCGLLYIYKISK